MAGSFARCAARTLVVAGSFIIAAGCTGVPATDRRIEAQ
jgi:hypothetical protein